MTFLELFGYFGSLLIAISLMMSNLKKLRWINLIGAAIFSTYGFLIESPPVFILNGWIVLINTYHLIRLYQFQDNFDMVRLSSVRTQLFELLMQRYGDDIQTFFPEATIEQMEKATALLIFRNMKPVGLFVYRRLEHEPATIEVLVDYVIPESRDFKTAQFLFSRHSTQLRKEAINTVLSRSKRPGHIAYLKQMGFEECGEGLMLDLR